MKRWVGSVTGLSANGEGLSRWWLNGAGEVERWRKVKRCPRWHSHMYRLRVGRRAHNAWRRTYGDGTG
ncbi:hypothetical protein GCM10023080_032670 [Streptomyces pseudoechinosporeus]